MNHHVGHLFARSGVLLLFHVVAATFPPLREAAGAEHRHRPQSHALVQGVGKDDAGGDRFVEVKSSGNVLDMAKVTKAKGGKLPKPHSRGRTRHREPSLATGGAKSSLSEAHRGWGGGEEGRASSDGEAELPEAVDLDQLRAQMPRLSLEDVVQEHEADIRRKIHELLEEHGMDPSKFKEHSMEFSKTKEPAKDTERTQKGFGVYENEHGSKIQMKVMHPGEFSAWRREPGRFNAMHMHEAKKYVDHHFDVARRQSRRSAMRKMRGFKEKAPTEDQAQFWDQQHEKLGAKAAADAAAAAAARNFTPAQRSSLSELGLSEALNNTAGGNCDTSEMGDHEKCVDGFNKNKITEAFKAPFMGLSFEVYFCLQIDIKLFSITGFLDGVYFHIGIQIAAKAPSLGMKGRSHASKKNQHRRQAATATGCWAFTFELSLGVSFGIHLPFGLTLGIGLSAFGTGVMEQKTFADTGMEPDEYKGPSGCLPAFAKTPEAQKACMGTFSEVFWTGVDELGLLVSRKSRPAKESLKEALEKDGGEYAKRQLYNWDLYTKIFQAAPEEPENKVYRVNCIGIQPAESKLRCLIRTRTNTAWCWKEGHCYRNQYQVSKERSKDKNNAVVWEEDDQAYSNFLLDHSTTVIEVGAGTTDFFATGKAQIGKAWFKTAVAGALSLASSSLHVHGVDYGRAASTEDSLDRQSSVDWPAVSPDKHWLAKLTLTQCNNANPQVIEVWKTGKMAADKKKKLTVQLTPMTRAGRLTVEVVEARKLLRNMEETEWNNQYVYAAVFLDPKVVLADTGPLFWTSTSQGDKVKWWGEGHAWSIFTDATPWKDMKERTAFSISLYSGSNVKTSSWTPPGAIEEWCDRIMRDGLDLWRCRDPCKPTPQCSNTVRAFNQDAILQGCQCVAKNPTPQLRSSRDTARSSSDLKLGEKTVTWEKLLTYLKMGSNFNNHGGPIEIELGAAEDIVYLPSAEKKKITIKVRLAWAPDTKNIRPVGSDVPQGQDKGKLVFASTGLKHAKAQFLAKVRKLSEQVLERVWDNTETDAESKTKFKGNDKVFPARVKSFDCVDYVSCYMRSWDGIGGARLPRKPSDNDKVAYKEGVDPSYWASDDRVANLAKALREATQSHTLMQDKDAKKAGWVVIKPELVSNYAHSLKYYEEIAYSAANLFVRTIGDVQALFNVFFANQAQWDGLCSSLEPSFELPFENFEFADGGPAERGNIPKYRYERQVLEDPGDVSAAYYGRIQPRASLHEFPSRYTKGWILRDPGTDVDKDILREFYIHNPASDHLWSYGHGFQPDEPNNNHKASMNFFTPDSPSVLSDHDDIPFEKSMPFAHEGDPSPTVYSRLWCDLAYTAFKKEVDGAQQRNFDQKWEVTIGRNHGKQPDYLGYQILLGLNGTGLGGKYDETAKVLKMGPLFEDSLLWNANVREGDSLYAVRGKQDPAAKAVSDVVKAGMFGSSINLQKLRDFLLPDMGKVGDKMHEWAQVNLPMTLYFSRPQDQQDVRMLDNLRKMHASSLAEEQPSRADEEGQKTAARPSGDLDAAGWRASVQKVVKDAAGTGRTLKIERACVDMQAKVDSDAKCEDTPKRTCETVELNTPFVTMFPHLLDMFKTFYEPKIEDILTKVQTLSDQAKKASLTEKIWAKAGDDTAKLITGKTFAVHKKSETKPAVLKKFEEDVQATLARWRELRHSKTKLMMEYAYELVYLVQLWLLDLGACGTVDGPLVEPLLARPEGKEKEAKARNQMCEDIHKHLSGAIPANRNSPTELRGLSSMQKQDFQLTLMKLFEKDGQRVKPKGNSVLNMMHRDFHAVFGVATAWPLAFQATKNAKENAKLTGHFWKYLADADPAARTADLRAKEAARAVDEEYLQKRLQSRMEETLQKYNMAIQPQGEFLVKLPFVETTFTATIRIETAVPGFCTPNEAFLLMDKSWSWTIRSWDGHYRKYQTCNSIKVHPSNWAIQLDTCRNAENDYKEFRLSFLLELGDRSKEWGNDETGGFDGIFQSSDLEDKLRSGNFFSTVDSDGFLQSASPTNQAAAMASRGLEGPLVLPSILDLEKYFSGIAAVWIPLRSWMWMGSWLLDDENKADPPAPSKLFLKAFKKQLADNVGIVRNAKKLGEWFRKKRAIKAEREKNKEKPLTEAEMKATLVKNEREWEQAWIKKKGTLEQEQAALNTDMHMDNFRENELQFNEIGVDAAKEDGQERKPLGAASSLAASSAAAAAAALQLRPGAEDGGGMSEGAEDGDDVAEVEGHGVEEEENPAGPAASSLAETAEGAGGSSEHGVARAQGWGAGDDAQFFVLQGSISIFAHKRKRLNELHTALYPGGGILAAIKKWWFEDEAWTWRIASPEMSLEAWLRMDPPELRAGVAQYKAHVGLNIVLPLEGIWNTIATEMIACRRKKIVKECQKCIENQNKGWCDTRYMKVAEYVGKAARLLDSCQDKKIEVGEGTEKKIVLAKEICESSLGWDREGGLVSGQWIVKGSPTQECEAIASAESGEAWVNQDTFRNLEQRILEKADQFQREQVEKKLLSDRKQKLAEEYNAELTKLLVEKGQADAMFQRINVESDQAKAEKSQRAEELKGCLECFVPKPHGPEKAFCLDERTKKWGCFVWTTVGGGLCSGVARTEKTIHDSKACEKEFAVAGELSQATSNRDKDTCSACLQCTRAGQKYCSVDNRCEYYQDAPTTCSSLEASMLLGAIQAVVRPNLPQNELNQNGRRAHKLLEWQCFDTGMTCNDKERDPFRRDCCLDFVAVEGQKDGETLVTMYKFFVTTACPEHPETITHPKIGLSKLRLEMQTQPQGNVLDEAVAQYRCAQFATEYLNRILQSGTNLGPQAPTKLKDMKKEGSYDDFEGMDQMHYGQDFGGNGGNSVPNELNQLAEPQWKKSGKTIWKWIEESLDKLTGPSTSNAAAQQTAAQQEIQEDTLLPTWFYATPSKCEAEIEDCKAQPLVQEEEQTTNARPIGPLVGTVDQIQRPLVQVKYRGTRAYMFESAELEFSAMNANAMDEAKNCKNACIMFDGDANGFIVQCQGEGVPCKGRVWSTFRSAVSGSWSVPQPVFCSTCVATGKKWCGTKRGVGTAPRTTWCEDKHKQCTNGAAEVAKPGMCQAQDPIVPKKQALYSEMQFVYFCFFRQDAYDKMDARGQDLCDRVIQAADMVVGDDDAAVLEDLDLLDEDE